MNNKSSQTSLVILDSKEELPVVKTRCWSKYSGSIKAEKVTSKDWFEWHKGYRRSPARSARLNLVRIQIANCLNACPTGEIRVVSVCAGDGRDLLGVLINHPRTLDVRARLVELDPRLVECGRSSAEAANLSAQVEFFQGDATLSSAYQGIVPADIVLVCGVFGNVSEQQTPKLIQNLPYFCKSGGCVVWTRRCSNPDAARQTTKIRELLGESNFEEVCFAMTPEEKFAVSTSRYLGEILSLPKQQQFFIFSDHISDQILH